MLPGGVSGFNFIAGNLVGVRPGGAAQGVVLTPGNNTYGSYTQLLAGASVSQDCYGILINVNSGAVSAAARDILVTLGIDAAGGTSYTDWIKHLIASCCSPMGTMAGGMWYYFPLYIKAGTSIAAKASVNNATVGTLRCNIWVFGAPDNPHNLRVGNGVDTIGAVTASSAGTSVTPGTTAEGAWANLGSTTRDCFAWQSGFAINNATITALEYFFDIASDNNANPNLIQMDNVCWATATEQLAFTQWPAFKEVKAGTPIYGRAQCSGTPVSGCSMIAYGVY